METATAIAIKARIQYLQVTGVVSRQNTWDVNA
jgi:hypothetical protein